MSKNQLQFATDNRGTSAYAPSFSKLKYSATLVSATEATFTVPGTVQNWVVSFSYQPGSAVWVSINNTATVPAGATLAATNSELNPGARRVNAGDVVHMITSNATAQVGAALYENAVGGGQL